MSVNEKMTAIADAIRAKTGGTDLLTLDGMKAAIESIQTGEGGDNDELRIQGYRTTSGSFKLETPVTDSYSIAVNDDPPDRNDIYRMLFMLFRVPPTADTVGIALAGSVLAKYGYTTQYSFGARVKSTGTFAGGFDGFNFLNPLKNTVTIECGENAPLAAGTYVWIALYFY